MSDPSDACSPCCCPWLWRRRSSPRRSPPGPPRYPGGPSWSRARRGPARMPRSATSTSTATGTATRTCGGPYGWEYECFELAARWANIAYGDPPFGWDAAYAYQMYATGPYQNPPFLRQPNGGSYAPQFGDLLVFDQTSFDPSGHVAVVTGVSGGDVNIIEQNWGDPDPTGYASLPIGGDVNGVWDPTYMPPRWGLPILGGFSRACFAKAWPDRVPRCPPPRPHPAQSPPRGSRRPRRPRWNRRCPRRYPQAIRPSAASVRGTSSGSGTDPAVPLPPCNCTWGTQFLPTGQVVSGSGSGSHPLPPTPSPTAGASATPSDIPPGISTMPPTNAPQPRIRVKVTTPAARVRRARR